MDTEIKKCQNCKESFTIQPEDFLFYKKIKVPPPTWCPECRIQRRLAFRNERSLHRRTCDLCKKEIISMYSPDSPFTVYCPVCWYSDRWDPLRFGREYDFSRPFFDQLCDLRRVVPRISLFQERAINSPWVNYEMDVKNCYLDIGGQMIEDSAYNQYLIKSKQCFDNYWVVSSEFCYESIFCENCYKTFFSIFCFDCRDTYFSFDCRNCSNIFGCSGLRHKEYFIFNKPVSKEEWGAFLKNKYVGAYSLLNELNKKALDIWKTSPQRATFIENSVNSTGNIVMESKNCAYCFNVEKMEDARHVLHALQVKDAYDLTSVGWGELLYELIGGAVDIYNIKFSTGILDKSSHVEYSDFLLNCHDCFGSAGLKGKEYCILNKRYAKEEYENLILQIKAHMDKMLYHDARGVPYKYGEYFPSNLSPFGYNESVANEYYPLGKEDAIGHGFNWGEYEQEQVYQFSEYSLPDGIGDVGSDILEKVLKCESSGKAYRIIPMELAFYRKFGLPLPRLAPFERHRRRLAFVAGHLQLHDRVCAKCGAGIKSVYIEDEFPLIHCEVCYRSEVA